MAKYAPLHDWLKDQGAGRFRCTFADIEEKLEEELPPSARQYEVWWIGDADASRTHVHKRAWAAAGYTVEAVDLAHEVVTFCRL